MKSSSPINDTTAMDAYSIDRPVGSDIQVRRIKSVSYVEMLLGALRFTFLDYFPFKM